jgi:hypothetical protein
VRSQVYAFLWRERSTEREGEPGHQRAVEQVMEALLQCNSSPSYSSECRLHSHQHRKRVRHTRTEDERSRRDD